MSVEQWVGVDDLERGLPGQRDQLAVAAQRRQLQVVAALLRGRS